MYRVTHLSWSSRRTDRGRKFVRNKAGKIRSFEKRQEARQWCRNHQYQYDKLVIVHPDGKKEEFTWDYDR
jgi:hypothetical protein